ncbi:MULTISPECIES: hypothetical protein [Streptomyces]|nr:MULTISPECIES: hypothetical protein [Streptomyces]WFB85843.1 hypothetical protein MMU79_22305 [Streptomyces olivaceus]WGK48530.1 hypothetical protein M6G09_24690 [Streptomyces sp. B146]
MKVKDIAEVTQHLKVALIETQHDLLGAVGWLPRLLSGVFRLGSVPQFVEAGTNRVQRLLL